MSDAYDNIYYHRHSFNLGKEAFDMNKKIVYLIYTLIFIIIYILQLVNAYNFKNILLTLTAALLIITELSSGLLTSGNRMQANLNTAKNENRFAATNLFLLLAIPPAIVLLLTYLTLPF